MIKLLSNAIVRALFETSQQCASSYVVRECARLIFGLLLAQTTRQIALVAQMAHNMCWLTPLGIPRRFPAAPVDYLTRNMVKGSVHSWTDGFRHPLT